MNKQENFLNRRQFIEKSSTLAIGSLLVPGLILSSTKCSTSMTKVPIYAHLWVYASKYPPTWDATPSLETIFSDLSYAKIDGLELMESILRYDDAVDRLNALIQKYGVPVRGSSYGVGMSMWDKDQYQTILDDIKVIIPRLAKVGGQIFGISVGAKPDGLKTEEDFDAQARILTEVRKICLDNGIEPNLHNHTYEVENDLHDLKGTLARIPDFKLGPDINWLIRGGVDPVDFINTYGKQIVYIHIRDQYEDGRWTEYIGQGATDFKSIAKALQANGFSGRAGIELAFEKDFVPDYELKETWKMSREYVQKTFGW